MEFLDEIIDDYYFSSSFDNIPQQVIDGQGEYLEAFIKAIIREIVRLEDSPVLYPSLGVRMEFLKKIAVVDQINNKILKKAESMIRHTEMRNELYGFRKRSKNRHISHRQRTSWQRFLHHGAPGVDLTIRPASRMSLQMLPQPGLHILNNWRRDFKNLARDVGQVSSLIIVSILVKVSNT